MITFFLHSTTNPSDLKKVDLHYAGCLDLAAHCSTGILSKDIQAWRDKARPGDIFTLNHELRIMALNHDLSKLPERRGNTIGASGILESLQGLILLGKRNADDEALPGLWCTPGGEVEPGEAMDAAISREFVEEVGLDVAVTPHFVYATERLRSNGDRVTLIFKSVTALKPIEDAKALEGFSEIAWVTQFALSGMISRGEITSMTEEALRYYYSKRGYVL